MKNEEYEDKKLKYIDIEFPDGSKFTIVHDFYDYFKFQEIMTLWLVETKNHNIQNLISFVKSLNPDNIFLTEEAFNKIIKSDPNNKTFTEN